MPGSHTKAIIIGGGIGGLATAIALRQVGVEAVVFERAGELREIGAGIGLTSNAVRALHKLGLGRALEAVSAPLERCEIRSWRGELLAVIDSHAIGRKLGAPSVGLHRADLQTVLAGALDRDSLRLGAACIGYRQEERSVAVRFADGREERGDLVIGADGLRSVIRAQLLEEQEPRYAGYMAWRGVTRLQDAVLPPGVACETWGRGSRFGVVPLGQGRVYWFATVNAPPGGHDAAGGQKREVHDRFRDWHSPIEAIVAATDEEAILRHEIYDRPPVRRWGEGRVTLLGDAAHPMTPNLSQGAGLAIEDALVLAKCLIENSDVPSALRRYEAQRQPRTAWFTRRSWRIGRIGQWENRWACKWRDRIVKTIPDAMTQWQLESALDMRFHPATE